MSTEIEIMENSFPPAHIRPIAICVVRKGDQILVFEAHKETEDETYYRPLGGAIEFGEFSLQTIRREFLDEINSDLLNLRFWHTLENIYVLEGRRGHEVVFVYVGDLADKTIYDKLFFMAKEDNGELMKVLWKPISDFQNGGPPLYPDGLLDLLTSPDAVFPKISTAPMTSFS